MSDLLTAKIRHIGRCRRRIFSYSLQNAAAKVNGPASGLRSARTLPYSSSRP